MTIPVRHRGAGHNLTPELLVRQVLLEGLVELAGDKFRQDEIFDRVDDMLQGTQETWNQEMREALLRMSHVGALGGIRVAVGYPSTESRLPHISIITESGAEEGGQATMGDVLGRAYDRDTNTLYTTKGAAWSSSVQIGAWATSGEASTLLAQIVRNVVFDKKGSLLQSGVHEISLSETGFDPGEQYYPRVQWVPMIRVNLEWTFRQTHRKKPVATQINPPIFTFTNQDL